MQKKTKIIVTVGPSSSDISTIKKMIEAGANVIRLNFSHGTHDDHLRALKAIRQIEKETGLPVAVMQDIQGPKIRLGILPSAGVHIKEGEKIVINTALTQMVGGEIPLVYPGLEKFIKSGHHILIDDGHAEVKVKSVKGTRITCEVMDSHILRSNKGLNFPDSHLEISVLSQKDKEDLLWGVQMNVDMVAISFVHTANEIKQIRKLIARYEKTLKIKPPKPMFIVTKIERNGALRNIDEILHETDGVMVARGDLAMETNMAGIPLLQKMIIDKAVSLTKPVIVATQMLDSMQNSRRPTRAEISDVANAVIDNADALMLSGETAVGKFPVETVKTMSDIIIATEESSKSESHHLSEFFTHKSVSRAIAGMSGALALQIGAKAIFVASATGRTGRLVSHVRPTLPVYAAVESDRALHELCLSWGIKPFLLTNQTSVEGLISSFLNYIKNNKVAAKGDHIVIITGEPVGKPGSTNLIEVRQV